MFKRFADLGMLSEAVDYFVNCKEEKYQIKNVQFFVRFATTNTFS